MTPLYDFGSARDAVFDQGLFACCRGVSRDGHPFKETEEGQLWIAAWQEGWDVSALTWEKIKGESAAAHAINPHPAYTPEAAAWLKGWREKHQFAVIDGDTAPTPRQQAG